MKSYRNFTEFHIKLYFLDSKEDGRWKAAQAERRPACRFDGRKFRDRWMRFLFLTFMIVTASEWAYFILFNKLSFVCTYHCVAF